MNNHPDVMVVQINFNYILFYNISRSEGQGFMTILCHKSLFGA